LLTRPPQGAGASFFRSGISSNKAYSKSFDKRLKRVDIVRTQRLVVLTPSTRRLAAFMDFLKGILHHWEHGLLFILFVLLAGGGVALAVSLNELEKIKRLVLEHQVPPAVTALDPQALDKLLATLEAPPLWGTNSSHRTFIAPPVVRLPNSNEIIVVSSKENGYTQEGLPWEWLRQYHLPSDRPVADTDPDHDGFTVYEEYLAHTNPIDPKSHPDDSFKLRVVEVFELEFPFVFNGVEEFEGKSYSICRKDSARTYFVKMNEILPDPDFPGYQVVDFHEKFEKQLDPTIKDGNGLPLVRKIDVSELVLSKPGSVPTTFVKGKPAKSGQYEARLKFSLENRIFEARVGDVFQLRNQRYQVLEIHPAFSGPEEVKIRNEGTEQEFVLKSQESEFRKLSSN